MDEAKKHEILMRFKGPQKSNKTGQKSPRERLTGKEVSPSGPLLAAWAPGAALFSCAEATSKEVMTQKTRKRDKNRKMRNKKQETETRDDLTRRVARRILWREAKPRRWPFFLSF